MAVLSRPRVSTSQLSATTAQVDAALDADVRCGNCGTAVHHANYCPQCGQEQHGYHRTLRALGSELLDTFAGWDGKIPQTFWILIRYPGRLTSEFLAGRRARYLRPLRLYLTTSILFFLALRVDTDVTSASTSKSKASAQRVSSPVTINIGHDTVTLADTRTPGRVAASATGPRSGNAIDDAWRALKRKRKQQLAGMSEADAKVAVREAFLGKLGKMFFVLLPLFALLVRLLYRRARVYYAEHLVFSLHMHAFLMLACAAVALVPGVWGEWAGLAAFIGIPAYLFVALHRVYGGSRRRTAVKTALLTTSYGLFLGLAALVTVLLAVAVG